MLSSIQLLLEKQDTKTLSQALLHTSRWLLGERLHYGPIQKRGLMANWLEIVTHFNNVNLCTSVHSENMEAGVFCLSSASSKTYFIVQCEHRDGAIKQLLQWVDSASLANHYAASNSPDLSCTTSIDFWPEPDPLQLSEFDPQLHLHTTHAGISDVLTGKLSDKNEALLTQWWQIWQGFDAACIEKLYNSVEHFSVNAETLHQGASLSISSWLTQVEAKLHRRYSQLEQVIADENSALIRWRIDADIKSNNALIRVRLPIATMISFNHNKIESEYWVVDTIAFEKRFNTPLPF